MSQLPVVVAMDFDQREPALALAQRLSSDLCRLKIGKELFTRCGPALVEELQDMGFDIFLDLKFHDIPNTVAGAVRAAADLGVWMVNVHASGGRRMMEAAADAVAHSSRAPILLGVTVLTSLTDAEMREVGFTDGAAERVLALATLAGDCGLDGVVCSAQEASSLRLRLGDTFCLVTPGIRLAGDAAGDQRRVMTPGQAIAAGANHLVMGRSITGATDPIEALQRVAAELAVIEDNQIRS